MFCVGRGVYFNCWVAMFDLQYTEQLTTKDHDHSPNRNAVEVNKADWLVRTNSKRRLSELLSCKFTSFNQVTDGSETIENTR